MMGPKRFSVKSPHPVLPALRVHNATPTVIMVISEKVMTGFLCSLQKCKLMLKIGGTKI